MLTSEGRLNRCDFDVAKCERVLASGMREEKIKLIFQIFSRTNKSQFSFKQTLSWPKLQSTNFSYPFGID